MSWYDLPVGPRSPGPVGRLFFVCPRAICLALEPKPRHCVVSVRYRFTGETQSMTRSFASPPENCKQTKTHKKSILYFWNSIRPEDKKYLCCPLKVSGNWRFVLSFAFLVLIEVIISANKLS